MYDSIRDLKILYVEDDSTMRKMFEEVLKKIVDTIYIANDGIEGLEIFKKGGRDRVVCAKGIKNNEQYTIVDS